MKKILKYFGVFAIVVTLVGMVSATIISAQEEPETPTVPDEEATTPPGPCGFRHEGREAMHEALAGALGITVDELEAAFTAVRDANEGERLSPAEMIDAVAAELGITADEFEAAKETARAEVLAQAVADGLLTQEQADQILEGEGFGPRGFGHGPRGFPGRGFFGGGDVELIHSAVAEALGITVDEFTAAAESADNPAALAEALDVTEEELADAFSTARTAALEAALADAVAAGKLTQEEADQILEEGFSGRGFRGRGFPNRGPRGNGFGIPDSAPAAAGNA